MSATRLTSRWMTVDEQQRFLRDLQKPEFSALRGIIDDSRSAGNLPALPPSDPMCAVGFCVGGAVVAAHSEMWGIFWSMAGRFGLFSTTSVGVHTNVGVSALAIYLNVRRSEDFFGLAETVGFAGGEGVAAEVFYIRTPSRDKDRRVIGWGTGAGVGVGLLPLEWFIELGYTENLWELNRNRTSATGAQRAQIQRNRQQVLAMMQKAVEEQLPLPGAWKPADALHQGLGKAAQVAQEGIKQLRPGGMGAPPIKGPGFQPPRSRR